MVWKKMVYFSACHNFLESRFAKSRGKAKGGTSRKRPVVKIQMISPSTIAAPIPNNTAKDEKRKIGGDSFGFTVRYIWKY